MILNLEINEIPKVVIEDFIKARPGSCLARLQQKNDLILAETVVTDIPEEMLYPSQTWATQNTGLPASEHCVRWYSDPINTDQLLWTKLLNQKNTVGIIGCVHSSKLGSKEEQNHLLQFNIPDCFSPHFGFVKPNKYLDFHRFNIDQVQNNGRVVSTNALLKSLTHIPKVLFSPRSWGISVFSIRQVLKVITKTLKTGQKEILRNAQFPLLASIFVNEVAESRPHYAALFSNHVAGNMHRYWYGFRPQDFEKELYGDEWVAKNRDAVFFSVELFDDFLNELLKNKQLRDYSIMVSSSMGQVANPDYQDQNVQSFVSFDGKITNINKFLDQFRAYCEGTGLKDQESQFSTLDIENNMVPQYGFLAKDTERAALLGEYLEGFLAHRELEGQVDVIECSVVITVTFSQLEAKYSINEAAEAYKDLGVELFEVDDHHTGRHCKRGALLLINANEKLRHNIKQALYKKTDATPPMTSWQINSQDLTSIILKSL